MVSSLGCRIVPEEIDGLAEVLNKEVFTFYTLEGAMAMQEPLERFEGGRLLINIADMPVKCPVAPIEFAFLADYYFHRRGIRDKVDITLVTPYSGAFTKPVANRVLTEIAERKQVNIVPNFSIERVDAEQKTIHSYEGGTEKYDLLCIIPPNLGPEVIESAGLGDASGYAFTDPRTMRSRQAERVYLIGDNSNVATSKAGSVAHFEAETVVDNILREIDGKKPLPTFDGHANCFIESGYHKALLLDFNYDAEPVEGRFPTAQFGPFSLLKESYMNHVGKIAFKWVYWHMLLPGYLPHVPLLPAHMNFVGKRVDEMPPLRHAHETKVSEAMKEPVCIQQGSTLRDAAQLMIEHRMAALPAVDVDGMLTGIVTESDMVSVLDLKPDSPLRKFVETLQQRHGHKKMGTVVEDIMTRKPATIGPDETLEHAAELMDKRQVHQLVVANAAGGVDGLISRSDLIRLFTLRA